MSQEYVAIQDAITALEVDETVLEPLVADLLRTNRIDVKVVDGERRFLFDMLLKLQEQDPTFGGRKTVEPQIAAPASDARRSWLDRRTLIQSAIGGFVATMAAEPLKLLLKDSADKR